MDRLMPKWRQLAQSGLFEPTHRIPKAAWLEGLVNAVVHRSYSMMGDHIRVEIFPNRLEIFSPGRFPGLADPRHPLQISRFARNPRIARVLSDMGVTRELGEGIKRMFEEMRRRGLSDPIYTQTPGGVRLTLLATDAVPPEVLARLTPSSRCVLDTLRLIGAPAGTGQLADAAGITRMTATRALSALAAEGLVTWQGTSKRDPRATWSLT
ncbi:ATP-binding protein [Propioniciclava sp. MC1595]|uniref:ATP-binding protein n=1 Tax=Propioniciclava sp. MC1595 TaxID=2760308 RepID=UPI001CB78A45|nr:ATP-binding protein [Propioniciclava sp. MC1595]